MNDAAILFSELACPPPNIFQHSSRQQSLPDYRSVMLRNNHVKNLTTLLAVGALLVSGAQSAMAGCGTCDKTIVENASSIDGFKTLVAAVKAAGLVDTLSGKGPFTVFAPTDEAFKKLPKGTLETLLKPENKDKLVAILKYHVVSGKVMAKDVVNLKKAKTVQGSNVSIKVKEGKVMIDKATVAKADVACSNGVIHVIDTVILPKEKKAKKAAAE